MPCIIYSCSLRFKPIFHFASDRWSDGGGYSYSTTEPQLIVKVAMNERKLRLSVIAVEDDESDNDKNNSLAVLV